MKSVLIIANVVALSVYSAEAHQIYSEVDVNPSTTVLNISDDVKGIRAIEGGTVFNITYEGDWTLDMKGAFEHAVRLLEECVPSSLPINVTAKVENLTSRSGNPLSKVSLHDSNITDRYNIDVTSLSSRVKGVLLAEHDNGRMVQFADSIKSTAFFSDPDITVSYNSTRMGEMSFSLEATPTDKYDFVSIVMRDLVKGLGINCDVKAVGRQLAWINSPLIHFEKRVKEALGKSNPTEEYLQATTGRLDITVNNHGRTLTLYAPESWDKNNSLNTFIPSVSEPLTRLMTYNFGKGCVIRNIADDGYSSIFDNLLGWSPMDYAFPITLSKIASDTSPIGTNGKIEMSAPVSGSQTVAAANYLQSIRTADGIYDFVRKYGACFYDDTHELRNGWTISVLLKNGFWERVYYKPDGTRPLNVTMKEIKLVLPVGSYARTCDGHLRCRVTNAYPGLEDNKIVNVRYYVIETEPQQVDMAYSDVVKSSEYVDDPYLREVRISIKNLEGAQQIFVSQLDEWNDYPDIYEVTDFKKGYFTAVVDKEFSSQFTITAVNDNGSTVSETYTLQPLEPADYQAKVSIGNEAVTFSVPTRRIVSTPTIDYRITPLSSYSAEASLEGSLSDGESTINIATLDCGIYTLSYKVDNTESKTIKFFKR